MRPLEILLKKGEISETLADKIEKKVEETNSSYEEVLLENGVSSELVKKTFAEYYEVPAFTIPNDFIVKDTVLSYIQEESAVHYKIVPLQKEDGVLIVGVNNPDDLQVKEVLNFISTKNEIAYKMAFLLESEIKQLQKQYSNLKGEVTDALEILESELDAEIKSEAKANEEDKKVIEHIEEDAPVTRIVATILRYAVDGSASDIHIEPHEERVGVRFRVDGVLNTSLELPINVHAAVVARIKILSSMRLDEKRKPQDGRFSATFDGRKIDFRVSILPTSFGEKVVMRILDNESGVRTLEMVGMTPHILKAVKRASGPTGSGKSTTLYSMLSEVDRDSKNVLSLEDPIEYNIANVSQSQMRPEIGYTFANGLRAALRQDPDIIMVGEIRDKETAQLAIQAALTGHLVLSTIHTNNAIGVVPRLIDMGVDPYLIAPTLKLAIAQRLARKICPGTGKVEEVSHSTQMMIDETFSTLPEKYKDRIPTNKTMVRPEAGPGCASGLRGRVAIIEALEISDEMQELILRNAPEDEVFKLARKNGFTTMKEDAIVKALNHEIPVEEMNAFGTKLDLFEEEEPPVNNPDTKNKIIDIMKDDEDTAD